MITLTSQEAPFSIDNIIINNDTNIETQHIAFIGDYTACSLLAGRAIKTQRLDYDESIYSMFDLPHNKSNYVCYWVKENHLVFKDNTTHYVIVHSDYRQILDIRRQIVCYDNELFPSEEIENKYNIQIVKKDDVDGLYEEQRLLSATDWEVVKQLEILLLSDTELGKARAKLREIINNK